MHEMATEVEKQLSKVKLLRENESLRKEWAKRLEERQVEHGTILVEVDQAGCSLFVLVHGVVEVENREGKVVHRFEAPARFGERGLFKQDAVMHFRCVAKGQCTVFELKAEPFLEVIKPELVPSKHPNGAFYGRNKGGVVSFKGIRFAKANRFRVPLLCDPPSTKDVVCVFPGDSCPQLGVGAVLGEADRLESAMVPLPQPKSRPAELLFLPTEDADGVLIGPDRIPQTDDCLQLNVFCPRSCLEKDAEKVPVMFYIHGGAFIQGAGSNALYEASELAAKGVVVVLINYRLGPLGFLYGNGIVPNLGLLDQITGLMWVQENIDYFGGDSENVTIFGESAGAMSCGSLTASPVREENPINRTLFQKAILQSGAALNAQSENQARNTATLFANVLGIANTNYDTIKDVPLAKLLQATHRVGLDSVLREDLYGKSMAFEPYVAAKGDQVFRGIHPNVWIDQGSAKGVATMIGVTKNEFTLFMLGGTGGHKSLIKYGGKDRAKTIELFQERIAKFLNDESRWASLSGSVKERASAITEAILQDIGSSTKEKMSTSEITSLVERFYSLWLFEIPCLRFAESQSKHDKVYVYRLDFEAQIPGLKACHAIDIPLVFGTWKHPMIQMLTGGDERTEAVSSSMQASWVNFAKDGNPTNEFIRSNTKTAEWPAFTVEKPLSLVFGANNTPVETIEPFPRNEQIKNTFQGVCMSRL